MTHARRTALATLTALMSAIVLATLTAPARAASTDVSARSAAGWVARDLERNAYSVGSGLSIDAVLLLAATGTSQDIALKAAGRIIADEQGYLGTPVNVANQAKYAFLLQAMGRDATSHLDAIRTSMGSDGHFANVNEFGQSWGIMALARSGVVLPDAVAYLQRLQASSGQIGKSADDTGMSVIALLAAGVPATDPVVTKAIAWMAAAQKDDGSFSNTNATGLIGHAARLVGTPQAVAIADGAAAYIRTLQVTCQSPLIAGDDPSVGGGFPVSWIGVIAYSDDAQDRAIESGIRPSQVTNWRYATLQAPLALPTVTNLATVTLAGAEPTTNITPTCGTSSTQPKPNVDQPVGDTGASTNRLRVRTSSRVVAVGGRTVIRVSGLGSRERYTMTFAGRLLAKGRATKSGTIRRSVRIPRKLRTHSGRVLRVRGTVSTRTGAVKIGTAAKRKLKVRAPRSVRRRAFTRIRVTGLLRSERYRVLIDGRRVASGRTRSGKLNRIRVRVPATLGTHRIRVCGVTCSRRGTTTVTVRR